MKKILAVSGGVDSMLLLWQYRHDSDAVVAHFNHGTRPSAAEDAKLVERMAQYYGLKFYLGKAELGPQVSEAVAREKRYEFLSHVATEIAREEKDSDDKYCKDNECRKNNDQEVKIYTAHHLNDLAESIAINLLRGTGWRGLTPFSNGRVVHPFIDARMSKKDVLLLAARENIIFRQDPTNVEDKYLRNRVRQRVMDMNRDLLEKLADLFSDQTRLRQEIDNLSSLVIESIKDGNKIQRDVFSPLPDTVALELLRSITLQEGLSLTRPQLKDYLSAIRTYSPEKKFNLPGDRFSTIHKHYFEL